MKIMIVLAALLITSCAAVDGEFPSVCQVPIDRELARCPRVRELRAWVSDDGSQVGCRLLVCGGEEHMWRWRHGRWAVGR
jgi:hypothetical protein